MRKLSKLIGLLAVILCILSVGADVYAMSEDDTATAEEETEAVITGVVVEKKTITDTELEELTVDGNMALVDDVDGESAGAMQFITVTSKNGNYFYIIIDRNSDGENTVHFLNQVDESDLLALMDDATADETEDTVASCICTVKCSAGRVNITCAVCKIDMTRCFGEEPETTAEVEEEAPSGNSGAMIFVLLLAMLGGGAVYYFKVLKNKSNHKGNSDLDEYDFGDDDDDYEDEDTIYDESDDETNEFEPPEEEEEK